MVHFIGSHHCGKNGLDCLSPIPEDGFDILFNHEVYQFSENDRVSHIISHQRCGAITRRRERVFMDPAAVRSFKLLIYKAIRSSHEEMRVRQRIGNP